jgi:hypothetical protein
MELEMTLIFRSFYFFRFIECWFGGRCECGVLVRQLVAADDSDGKWDDPPVPD